MNTQLYRDEILEYWRHPRYAGMVDRPTHASRLENILCGDAVRWTIRVRNGIIQQALFEADGCALSVAGAAVVAEAVQGRSTDCLKRINQRWLCKTLNINPGPARERCVTLGLEALHKAFN